MQLECIPTPNGPRFPGMTATGAARLITYNPHRAPDGEPPPGRTRSIEEDP